MGCGKTTLGKQLALELDYDFIDTDTYIESKEQMSITEIFAQKGEEYFRKCESDTLIYMSQLTRTIISTGGGLPCNELNITKINSEGMSIYIKLDVETLANRLSDASSERPLVAGKTKDELIEYIDKLLTKRQLFYSRARMTIDGVGLDVNRIIAFL